jgi:RimJ/RimL family protein N-acetyltransferase
VLARREVWVVEGDDRVVALLVLDGEEIDQLYVDPEWTGRGLGSQLIDVAKARSPSGLSLWAFQSNTRARHFYEQHGFIAGETTEGENEEGAPDVRYRWATGDLRGFRLNEHVLTPRLVLRPFSAAFARAVIDGNVTGFNVAAGYPHRDTPDIARAVLDESAPSTSTWLITRRSDGLIVGDCGWFPVAGAEDAVEIGYGLAEPARGQGFATEAVGALLERVWDVGVTRIIATTDEDNQASARVVEKLGFQLRESRDGQRRYECLLA